MTLLTDLSDSDRIAILAEPAGAGPIPMVLDTDTYNEIDDQFALAYALLSPGQLDLQAVYAAPFSNDKTGPADGMRLSYEEISRVLARFGRGPERFALEGSKSWMSGPSSPVESPAASDLISRARESDLLYVVAIGAPTNVASALLLAPDIAGKIVVVWLGGNPSGWHSASEYNLYQDPFASRVLFDSGVPLVHVPCVNVAEHVRTTLAEIDFFVRPNGPLGAYLAEIYEEHCGNAPGVSKVLWDIAAVAWLVNPAWTPTSVVHSPILTTELTWSHDSRRHHIREMYAVHRDAIFADFFSKLRLHSADNPAG